MTPITNEEIIEFCQLQVKIATWSEYLEKGLDTREGWGSRTAVLTLEQKHELKSEIPKDCERFRELFKDFKERI